MRAERESGIVGTTMDASPAEINPEEFQVWNSSYFYPYLKRKTEENGEDTSEVLTKTSSDVMDFLLREYSNNRSKRYKFAGSRAKEFTIDPKNKDKIPQWMKDGRYYYFVGPVLYPEKNFPATQLVIRWIKEEERWEECAYWPNIPWSKDYCVVTVQK